jgi:hypothetical protein
VKVAKNLSLTKAAVQLVCVEIGGRKKIRVILTDITDINLNINVLEAIASSYLCKYGPSWRLAGAPVFDRNKRKGI